MYRIFLDQLTLGMIEVGDIFDDDSQKFEFQEEFKELYGPQKTSGPTFGHMQVRGSSGRGNSAPTGQPELTEAALSKHQQQIGKRGPQFAPSGRQHDSGRGSCGQETALTADALSRLQLEKHASPWGERSGVNRQQRQQNRPQQQPAQNQQQWRQHPDIQGQPPVRQQQRGGYVRQQLDALGWDTWDQGPTFRKEDKDCRVKPPESSSGSGW